MPCGCSCCCRCSGDCILERYCVAFGCSIIIIRRVSVGGNSDPTKFVPPDRIS